jgi:hypothetical protein
LRWACGEAEDSEVDEISMTGAVTLTHYFASHAEQVRAAMTGKTEGSAEKDKIEGVLLEKLLAVVSAGGGRWDGTATDLLKALEDRVDPNSRLDPHWPRSADSLGRLLRKKSAEWERSIVIGLSKTADKKRTRIISFQKASEVSKCPTQTQVAAQKELSGRTLSLNIPQQVSVPQVSDSQDVPTSSGHSDTSDASRGDQRGTDATTGLEVATDKADSLASSTDREEGDI